ncbi:TauD/TfdA family dioxygenase, partial [Xanthomonas perforans]
MSAAHKHLANRTFAAVTRLPRVVCPAAGPGGLSLPSRCHVMASITSAARVHT